MNFLFPRAKFADENGIVSQLLHTASECQEAILSSHKPDIHDTAMEVMDILHSCETALRICQEKYNVNLGKVRRDVEQKNSLRGYYDECDG